MIKEVEPLNFLLNQLESHFLPAFSPEQLELSKKPTHKEKRLVSSFRKDYQSLITGKQISEKKEEWYEDLLFYTTQFTLFQRKKQKEQGKEESFFLHDEQILALIRAVNHYQDKKEGLILEMKTGEGKSQIVIPIFLSWLGKRETNIHIHEINPFLLNEAYNQFLDFAKYLGIEDQVGKVDLGNIKQFVEKKFVFGLWHDFVHWYQYSFLDKKIHFPLDPILILDEIDQLLMDEALTPDIISRSIRSEEFLNLFLRNLQIDLFNIERSAFEFSYQDFNLIIDPKDFDKDLQNLDNFKESIRRIIQLPPLVSYIKDLDNQRLSDEKKAELLAEKFNYIIFTNIIFGKLREKNPDFQPNRGFLEKIEESYEKHQPIFWFDDPEVSHDLISVLIMKEGKGYIIKEGKVIPLSPTTGYQEEGKKFSPLVEIFLHLKHGLDLPETVTINTDRLSTFEFYQRLNRIYGFTGTASTVARRLYQGYGLETILIPTHYQDNRQESFLFFLNSDEKINVVEETVINSEHKNILIATNNPEEAQELEKRFKTNQDKLEVKILSAENEFEDHELYQWISSTSKNERRKVLITVKMIGRGVDLKPDDNLIKENGFLLLVTSPFEYQRSYFQLTGRIGRRGERGEVITFVDFNDLVFFSLNDDEKRQLEKFFKNPQRNQGKIKEMIRRSWCRKEDELTERFHNKKNLFWPIINLRNYLEKDWSFSEVKEKWIKKGARRWENEARNDYVLLPSVIEEKFKAYLKRNWIEVVNDLEDNLKGMVSAGSAGPFGQMNPQAATAEVYRKILEKYFHQFLDQLLEEEKVIFALEKIIK